MTINKKLNFSFKIKLRKLLNNKNLIIVEISINILPTEAVICDLRVNARVDELHTVNRMTFGDSTLD